MQKLFRIIPQRQTKRFRYMQQIEKYHALLSNNNAEDNLLAFYLLMSQQAWSSEQALSWILHFFVESLDRVQEECCFNFGTVSLSFKVTQSKIDDQLLLREEALYRIILMSYLIKNNQRTLLHKIDYLENESQLLSTYQSYILNSLPQILPTFSQIFY